MSTRKGSRASDESRAGRLSVQQGVVIQDRIDLRHQNSKVFFAEVIRKRPVADLRPFQRAFRVASLLGVVPFSLKGRTVTLVPWKLAYTVVCSSLVAITGIYTAVRSNILLDRSSFAKFIFYVKFIPFSVTLIILGYQMTVHHRQIGLAIDKWYKISRILSSFDVTPKIRYNYLYRCIFQIFLILISIAHVLPLWNYISTTVLSMFFCFNYGHFYMYAAVELLLFFLDTTHCCLEAVVKATRPRTAVLLQLCAVHDCLADVIAIMEKVYSLPLLGVLLSSFFFINGNVIVTMKIWKRGGKIISILWTLSSFLPIIRMAYSCEKITKKVSEYNKLLCKFMKKDRTYNLIDNIYLSAHLTRLKSFDLSVGGFTVMRLKLVGGMIAAIATYSIIFIQFGASFIRGVDKINIGRN